MSKNKTFNIVCWIFVVIFLMITIFPFFWILISSFKPESEIFGANAYRIIAENPTLENYRTVIVEKGMLRAIGNSFVMSAATTFYVVIVASMSAYIISRFKFKGKALLMGLILAVAMFPQMIVVGPIFNMFYKLKILNTYWVCLAYSTITLPSAVWIMVAHFNQVPLALEEAAKIDGCSPFMVMTRIFLPVSSTGIAVAVIFAFTRTWNEFLFAFTFISTTEKKPIIVSLYEILKNNPAVGIPWHYVMAGAMYTTVPLVILFICIRNYITGDHTAGAIK